jgi:hypothetical protein
MSKRRSSGEVVELDSDDSEGTYLVRIVPSAGDVHWDECAVCDDKQCREWRKTNVLDKTGRATTEFVHHVAECNMRDAPTGTK